VCNVFGSGIVISNDNGFVEECVLSLSLFFLLFHFEILLWKMNALNWLYNMYYCIHDANRVCNVCLCKL
jgi:hypothetical protein